MEEYTHADASLSIKWLLVVTGSEQQMNFLCGFFWISRLQSPILCSWHFIIGAECCNFLAFRETTRSSISCAGTERALSPLWRSDIVGKQNRRQDSAGLTKIINDAFKRTAADRESRQQRERLSDNNWKNYKTNQKKSILYIFNLTKNSAA